MKLKSYLFLILIMLSSQLFAQPGANDLTFNSTGTGFMYPVTWQAWQGYANISAIQSDGKIVVGGYFASYNGVTRNNIARLNSDGSLDLTFNPGSGTNYWVNSIAIQSDGKIIIGGDFTSYNGVSRNRIARLNADGTLDATFNVGSGFNNSVFSISLQQDGKLIIGGDFSSYNGVSRRGIARLNANGTLDTGFNPGSGIDPAGTIYSTSIQTDGKVIIAGGFDSFNGIQMRCIARLNTNGSLDALFNPGVGPNNYIRKTIILSNGKILIGGEFTTNNGVSRKGIERLNSDGSSDAAFNPGNGVDYRILTMSIQPDDKIIIGGEFTSYNGISRNNVARLNDNGALDLGFNPGNGANFGVFTTALQVDGKIIIGGTFTTYDQVSRNYIARILNPPSPTISSFNPTSACSGTGTVVITGTNFTDASAVSIGGIPVSSFTVLSATEISATIGNSSTGVISVTTPGGTGVSTTTFTVNTLPMSAGQIIGSSSVCQGQNAVTYELPSIANATSYVWTLPSGVSGSSTTNSITVDYGSSAASGNITVKGNNACGFGAESLFAITVNQLPNVSAGSDQTICEGNPIALSGSGAVNYSWDNAAQNGVSFIPTGTQVYTVTGTDANNCSNTDQVSVTVNSLPTINAGADQTVCAGIPVTLSGSGAVNYSWTNSVQNSVSFIPSGTQVYTVTGTDANNCSNTDQVTVTVNTLPTINAGSDQTICEGNPIALSGSGAVNYSWDNSVQNSVSFIPTGTQVYTVTGTDANNCSNTDQVTVTVNTLPTINAGVDQTVCAGTPITLSGSGAVNYSWDNAAQNGVSFIPTGTQVYTVTGTDANNCSNTDQVTVTVNALPTINAGVDQTVCAGIPVTLSGSGAVNYSWDNSVQNSVSFIPTGTQVYTVTGTDANNCSNTDQVTVTVNALPTINAGADQTVCDGDPVTLTASGGTSYAWNNSIQDGVSFTPSLGSTTYTVTGTDANNCTNTDDVIVTVNTHTTATQTQSALDSYTWPVNGQTYSSSGTYTATIPNTAGCDSTITLNLTFNFTGISETEMRLVRVYPNPSIDHITVEVESELIGKGYTLYDVMGKKILSGVLTSEKNLVSMSGLSTGIYTFKIEGADGQSIRIVKNE